MPVAAVVHKSEGEDVTAGDKMVSRDQKDRLGKANQSCRILAGQAPLMALGSLHLQRMGLGANNG